MKKLFVLLFFLVIKSAQGQDNIECDRPDQTETAALVPDKHFQMESGIYYEHFSKDERQITHPAALLKYGFKDVAEFRFEIESSTQLQNGKAEKPGRSGLNPIAFGMKLKICEEQKARPKISVIAMTSIPVVANHSRHENFPSPEIRFLFQHSLSEKFSLSYNLGVLWSSEEFRTTALYTLTSGYAINDKWGCYVEFYGFVPVKAKSEHFFDGGITFLPRRNVMLDISAGLSVDKKLPSFWTGFGVSFRLPN